MTKVRSMQKVRGQRSRSHRSQPNLTVSGCNRASTRIFARGYRDISRGCTRRKKVKVQSKNIMSGKIPADADRYGADGCVGRRQLTEALCNSSLNRHMMMK